MKLITPGLCALSGSCVVLGAINALYASDTWQVWLRKLAGPLYDQPMCSGQYSVGGWGDAFIVVAAVIALAAIAAAAWGAFRTAGFVRPAIVVALLPTVALWMSAYAISWSSEGDCDGIGLTGSAAVAAVHSGWLFFAAMLLLAAAFLWVRSREPVYSSAIPASPRRV